MSRFFSLLFLAALPLGCAVKIIPPGADSQALLRPIEDRLAAIRDLAFLEPVPVELVSPSQVRAILSQELDKEMPPDRLEAERELYLALDLISPDLDLRQTILDLYSKEVAAFYVPDRKTLTVVTPIRKPLLALRGLTPGGKEQLREIILSHELVHALEDQNFHLERFNYHPGANQDFLLAVQAVCEGSALLAGTLYLLEEAGVQSPQGLEFILNRIQKQKLNIGNGRYPAVLTEPMAFTYQAGLGFVYAVYQARGFAGINALYQETELSTEHILHPDKYLAGSDLPAALELPALSDLLAGWKLLDQNTMGEFGAALILEQRLGKDEAKVAAAGWAGDTYALFKDGQGRLLFLWYSAWDNENEAEEFKQALSHWAAREPAPSPLETAAIYAADRRVLSISRPQTQDAEALARRFNLLN
ncbi:MAG: hypothetical protein A2V67_14580 [Deltaproteobacteria bacterium RBG_13_61_14]|nr:MAG: hypothetical protein A2V67_14580 [Deltaproteobacteria bacterium RBG_13_61_14]